MQNTLEHVRCTRYAVVLHVLHGMVAESESESEFHHEFHWNAQSILGTATIFTDLGTAARAASVICDGPALGRTEVGTHPGIECRILHRHSGRSDES